MELLNKDDTRTKINDLTSAGIPFLFMVNFNAEQGVVVQLTDLMQSDIACCIKDTELGRKVKCSEECTTFNIQPISFNTYRKSFDNVQQHIKHGDTYLLNLTFASSLGKELKLETIYKQAKAPYKLLFGNQFLFYSPEPFIRIEHNQIYSFPMKGTISASVPNAAHILMENKKELYEHYTIVDLIRNDLSMVSSGVEVQRFRYIETLITDKGSILQTSSQISGNLPDNWKMNFGDILFRLLPAGSICGAPKEMTVGIIKESELSDRGFYTGVMGVFDGKDVDSCVIIRYIERGEDGCYYYRSGGGITSLSLAEEEYSELITKVYVPTI